MFKGEPKSVGEITSAEAVSILKGVHGSGAKREFARMCATCSDEIDGVLRAARQEIEMNRDR